MTLGEHLRGEREKRGITIEQVASATRINVKVLHALEGDHFDELPAKPFIRGFVISYCRFIGLNSQEVLTQFDSFIDSKTGERPMRDEGHKGYAFDRSEEGQSRSMLWAAMGATLILGAVLGFVVKPSLHRRRGATLEKLRAGHPAASPSPSPAASVEPSPSPSPVPEAIPSAVPSKKPKVKPSPKPSPSVIAPAPEGSPAPVPSPSANPDPLNSGKDIPHAEVKHKVILKALANVWVRYQVDGKPKQSFILKKDKLLYLVCREKILLQFSNPKAIKLNGDGSGFHEASEDSATVLKGGTPAQFFPRELSETVEDPFPGDAPLPETQDPAPDQADPVSTPSP